MAWLYVYAHGLPSKKRPTTTWLLPRLRLGQGRGMGMGQGMATSLAETTALSENKREEKSKFTGENEKALVSKGDWIPPRGLEPLLPD